MVAHRPDSRITRDKPMITAMMFPNALRAIRKFSPRTWLLVPKTFVKKRLAAVRPDDSSSSLGTGVGLQSVM